jgi:hypothetical protein
MWDLHIICVDVISAIHTNRTEQILLTKLRTFCYPLRIRSEIRYTTRANSHPQLLLVHMYQKNGMDYYWC